MATLKQIKGTGIQFRDDDPVVYAGSWSSGGALNTATLRPGGVGTQTAALSIAGVVNPNTVSGKTESYNGTAWTELGDLNTTRYIGNFVFGTQTAAIGAGGATTGPGTPTVAVVEQWNGSAWTEVGDLNKTKAQGGGSGTTSGGLIFGGFTFPGAPPTYVVLAETETWNGSAWTEVNDLNATRYTNTGSKGGSSTASITFGRANSPLAIVEKWDGTNWTEVGDLNSGRESIGGSGTSTDGLGFGGTPNTTKTEAYNGTSWTEVADLSVGRSQIGGTGASGSSALAFGGATPSESTATEEWSFPPSTSSILQEGLMWFNSSSSALKAYGVAAGIPSGTWASGGTLNSGRYGLSASQNGPQNATIFFGGAEPAASAKTEEYNGTAFTEVADMGTARTYMSGGAGTSTAALGAGGEPGRNDNTQLYNGSSWSEVSELNQAASLIATGGIQTSAFAVGGQNPSIPTIYVSHQTWDGSSWTETTEVNTGRYAGVATGASNTASIVYGGQNPGTTNVVDTEIWNGTSWTEVNNLNEGRKYAGGCGTTTSALLIGGDDGSNVASNEFYNGTSWTELNDLSVGRGYNAASGTGGTDAITAGGLVPGSPNLAGKANSEQWGVSAAVVTVTTS